MSDQFWIAIVLALGKAGFMRIYKLLCIALSETTLDDKLCQLDAEGVMQDANLEMLSLLLRVPENEVWRTNWWQTYRNTN